MLLLGRWSGGRLCLTTGAKYWKPGVLYRIPWMTEHWVTPTTHGDRFSIVFYSKVCGAPVSLKALRAEVLHTPRKPLGLLHCGARKCAMTLVMPAPLWASV